MVCLGSEFIQQAAPATIAAILQVLLSADAYKLPLNMFLFC
jgi:hypothetical protein